MIKKPAHIVITLIFSLNIMGAGLASASPDCVMACCDSSLASAKDISLAARDCCDDLDSACGPDAAGHPEFEGILPCPIQTHTAHLTAFSVASPPASAGTAPRLHPSPSIHHPIASTQPLFILNLSWIC